MRTIGPRRYPRARVEYASSDNPAAPPGPPSTSTSVGGRRSLDRVRRAVRHPEASAALLAILIGVASVFTAVLAWRASLASIDSSRYESLAVQQLARQNQIERELEGLVAQDLRFVNLYQEHLIAAQELRAQADSIRESDPARADILDLEAHSRQDLARGIVPLFQGARGVTQAADGTVIYDVAFVLGNLRDGHGELSELLTQRTPELAQRADTRSLGLVGVAAIVVAALFFLTVAQVTRATNRVRQVFFVGGGLLVVFGVFGFAIVEALW
jgi:hypothetical protein